MHGDDNSQDMGDQTKVLSLRSTFKSIFLDPRVSIRSTELWKLATYVTLKSAEDKIERI